MYRYLQGLKLLPQALQFFLTLITDPLFLPVPGQGAHGNIQITITDVAGRVVATDHAAIDGPVIEKSFSLGAEVPAGVYFINLKGDGIAKTLKLVEGIVKPDQDARMYSL
jgi:hypothetical protein